ncbi:unnamed protein product [Rangifer tarandus platyrhynchus]|uniref:Uncharacterized protein n=2 Tax=Rangifer tarandus platyrhynchus TaxID=3082113 RepID=A0ABN8Y7U5_RANTA|nr:unnamed protein product [Rangifer tarandus platyrhynchus]
MGGELCSMGSLLYGVCGSFKYAATSSYPAHKKVRSHFVNKGPAVVAPGFPAGSTVKKPSAVQEQFDPWVKMIPWRRKWQLTPVILPEKSHGQRSLAGYSPWVTRRHDLVTKQQHSDSTSNK